MDPACARRACLLYLGLAAIALPGNRGELGSCRWRDRHRRRRCLPRDGRARITAGVAQLPVRAATAMPATAAHRCSAATVQTLSLDRTVRTARGVNRPVTRSVGSCGGRNTGSALTEDHPSAILAVCCPRRGAVPGGAVRSADERPRGSTSDGENRGRGKGLGRGLASVTGGGLHPLAR